MFTSTKKFIATSGLVCAIAGLGVAAGAGVANAQCVTASNPAGVDCDGIQHAQLSGETRRHVDGHGWVEGQGVEDLKATDGELRGPCMKRVTCHT